MFSWIPMYAELAQKLMGFRDHQQDLINLLKEMSAQKMPVVSVTDQNQGKQVPLAEIDPFTFFASFNRGQTHENKKKILAHIKGKLDLKSEVPTDFAGIPVVNNMKSWFFPAATTRKPDDIPSLWALAQAALQGGPETLDAKFFDRCLEIEGVGPAKLTMGLFWLNPKQYIAWDGVNQALFTLRGVEGVVSDLDTYQEMFKKISSKLGSDYPKISLEAWELSESTGALSDGDSESSITKSYWAGGFQWAEGSQLEDFITHNHWKLAHSKESENSAAKKSWQRFAQVKIGDEFAIKGLGGRNDLRIHYVGKVIGKSDDGVLNLKQIEGPLFRGKAPAGPTWFDTVVAVNNPAAIKAIFGGGITVPVRVAAPANQILYGPPGTGKTYHVIERAVEIIDGISKDDHAARKIRFDALSREGRIGFITFHQSYSYEDFIEGIRPVLSDEDESTVPRYECRPGIFKQIAVRALFECLRRTAEDDETPAFEGLWTALVNKIEEEPEASYPGLTAKTAYRLAITSRGNIEGVNTISGMSYSCSRRLVEKVFEAKRGEETVNASAVMAIVNRGCHAHLIAAVFNALKRIAIDESVTVPAPASYTGDEKAGIVQRFLADGVSSGYRAAYSAETMRYVLVIDEINRGNISKILGELITLIEVDKRLPGENGLALTLPYSGDRFAVPPNLFVLGTMNTADKSIALVDLALRRRFEFEEMSVDLSVCKGLSPDMLSAIGELNRRISLRKDRDHLIGHAYFIKVNSPDSFDAVFRRQVIPLLQEYFFNDWEGLRYVLAETSTTDGKLIKRIKGSEAREARTKWQWYFDDMNETVDVLETLLANYASGAVVA